MKIEKISSELLGESYYSIKHESGLQIFVYPKEGYASTYAIFGTRYGSIDTKFKRSDENDFTVVPEGIAHFLEHKLFESEELDAFQRYAETGADANAYTSFDRTCYLFSCSGDYKKSLEILLDFVQNPYFTEQTVKKEQGIIGQEIKMMQDEPSWQVVFNLLRAAYHNHPVRIDIAGTVESIAQITPELLYSCYNTFYNLNNMVLCVAGKITVDEVTEIAERLLKKESPISIERSHENEPKDVKTDYIEQTLPVAMPLFALGFKENIKEPEQSARKVLTIRILLELLAGKTSDLYNKMLDDGIINKSFDTEYFNGFGYATVIFSGESNSPLEVKKQIIDEIKKYKANGIDEKAFERIRRKLYGSMIMSYNDVDEIANEMVDSYFSGIGYFDSFKILSEITASEIFDCLSSCLDENNVALSIIKGENK